MSAIVQLEGPLLERLALKVFDDIRLNYCTDPILIAQKLGLQVVEVEGPSTLIGNVLSMQALPSWRDAGLVTYQLLAKHLLRRERAAFWSEGAEETLTDALILPRRVAARVPIEELPAVQRYAPVDVVERIWLAYPEHGTLGSGDAEEEAPAEAEPMGVVIRFKPRAPKRTPGSLRTAP
jgi:hypothetical protein